MKLRARLERTTATMVSKHLDMMYIVHEMQRACTRDNANHNSVVKTFRMGAWLAYVPTPDGLEQTEGRSGVACRSEAIDYPWIVLRIASLGWTRKETRGALTGTSCAKCACALLQSGLSRKSLR